MTTNSIQYIAKDKGSYTSLANFAVTLGTDVTLFPDYNTIVLTEASANDAGACIDKEGLNFHIEPVDADDIDPEMLVSFRTADAATLRRLAERLIDQKAAVDEELAAADLLETGDHAQRGRLAAAARAHDTDKLTGFNLEVDILQRGSLDFFGAVDFFDTA